MMQETHDTSNPIQTMNNPGLLELGKKFLEKGWCIKVNNENFVEFQSPRCDYDTIEFQIEPTSIFVSVPLKSSRYKYCAKFSDYFLACDFAEMHLLDYE